MNNFEAKRELYYRKLRNNKELLNSIITETNKKENGQRNIEILVTPENEKELAIAEATFSLMGDMTFLIEQVLEDNIKSIPAEKNEVVKMFVRVINELKNGKTDVEFISEDAPAKLQARIIYELIVTLIMDAEGTFEYIAQKTGYDLEDELDKAQLQAYFNKAQRLSNKSGVSDKNFDDMTDKNVETLVEITKEIRKLIVDGIVNINDNSISEEQAKVYQKTKE